MLLGRICLSAIFISAGIGKFMSYEETAAYMASAGMTQIPMFLYAAAIVEILGGLAILLGWKARWGALLLLLFLIPVSLLFHNFWALAPELAKLQMILFMKNVAIAGGLLYVAATGAGCFSIDHCCKSP